MTIQSPHTAISFHYPDWIDQVVDWSATCKAGRERMRLAIAVSRANVEHGAAPFGAAIFEMESGRVVSVGMDCAVARNNCALHGEMVAFMMAQQRVGSHTLDKPNLPSYELVTSCEPCARAGIPRILRVPGGTRHRFRARGIT